MKSHLSSDGRIFPVGKTGSHLKSRLCISRVALAIIVLSSISVAGCAGRFGKSAKEPTPREQQAKKIHGKPIDQLVPESEVTLREDRQKFSQLRKDVPSDKKIENDELADLMALMGEVKYTPNQVRSRFTKLIRKRRTEHRKAMRKARTLFSKNEKKFRDKFLNEQRDRRDRFRAKAKKMKPDPLMSREERKEFFDKKSTMTKEVYADISDRRKEYFENERERRREFESLMRDKSKEFNAFMREKTREFYQEHREYSKTYQRMKKDKQAIAKQKRLQNVKKYQQRYNHMYGLDMSAEDKAAFREMETLPATPLGPKDN